MEKLQDINRLVIKIGSSIITRNGSGLDKQFIGNIASQVRQVRDREGTEVAIVSSGAVAAGRISIPELTSSVVDTQAAAMYGQPELLADWVRAFKRNNVRVAQALYTDDDLGKASHPLRRALQFGVVVINANDAVYDREIRAFMLAADNDKLSGYVAKIIDAEMLILLTGVDGVLDRNGRVIRRIRFDEKVDVLEAEKSGQGTGGIESKIQVAREFASLRKTTTIANGRRRNILLRILSGEEVGTCFVYN